MTDKKDVCGLTKEEIVQILDAAAMDKNAIVIDSAQLDRLKSLGVAIQTQDSDTIDEFFLNSRQHADMVIDRLPPIPNWLEYQFRRPYYEARCALLIGLYGISITASAILLERVLKWTAFNADIVVNGRSHDDWIKIEDDTPFGKAINYARSVGLVNKELAEKLEQFRTNVRNIQGHAKVYKATEKIIINDTSIINLYSGEVLKSESVNANTDPTLAAIAKEQLDAKQALEVFQFMHDCITHLFSKLDDKISQERLRRQTA